jgi:hypothetical protein
MPSATGDDAGSAVLPVHAHDGTRLGVGGVEGLLGGAVGNALRKRRVSGKRDRPYGRRLRQDDRGQRTGGGQSRERRNASHAAIS